MAVADPDDVNAVRSAATNAHAALTLRARSLRRAEDQTGWEGPGRRQYDEESAEALRRVDRLRKDLERAERLLDRAVVRLDEELEALGRDEQKVRAYREPGTPGPPGRPDPAIDAIRQRLRWNPPPKGDPEWAAMARTLYGRSESKVP